MKVSHAFRDSRAEREIGNEVPLAFCIPNKIGGMLLLDAQKDTTKFFARVKGRNYSIFSNISAEGKINSVSNRLHTIEITREGHEYGISVPYYTNSLLLNLKKDEPVELKFSIKEMGDDSPRDNSISEKDGRILVTSSGNSGMIFAAIQGENLSYSHDLKKGKDEFTVCAYSGKISIVVSGDENEALKLANHIIANQENILKMQDNYLGTAKEFSDQEAGIAYAAVLNLLEESMGGDEETIPAAIAKYEFIGEGEFEKAKKGLLYELARQKELARHGQIHFEEAGWTVILLGRLLNRLCQDRKLYSYLSAEMVKAVSADINEISDAMSREAEAELDRKVMLLAVNDLVHALTRSPESKARKEKLLEAVREGINSGVSDIQNKGLSRDRVYSIFKAHYIYPVLHTNDEWREIFDSVLEAMQYSFQTLQSKMQPGKKEEIELFGIMNLAAAALNRTDAEHYEKTVNAIMRDAVTDALYKGVVGRPTSSFEHDPTDKEWIFSNRHALNGAFFLEMLRECA